MKLENPGSVERTRNDPFVAGANRRGRRRRTACPAEVRTLAAALLVAVGALLAAVPARAQNESNATGKPAISGVAQVGMTLTASTSDIEDSDGLTGATFSYQWIRVDDDGSSNPTDIGTDSSTYTLTASEVGKQIRVKVTFTDDAANAEELTSDAYPADRSVVAAKGACPAVNDWCATMTVGFDPGAEGGVLGGYGYEEDKFGSLDPSEIDYGGESSVVIYVHLNVSAVESEINIGTWPRVPVGTVFNLGGRTFTGDADALDGAYGHRWPLPADLFWLEGQELTVSVVLGNFPATGRPAISGTAETRQTLTVDTSGIEDPDGLTSVVYAYQWIRVDGGIETEISGATGTAYTLVGADAGKKVMVRVSFTDDRGNAETATSRAYPAGSGSIAQGPNDAPEFDEGATATRSLNETVGAARVQAAADLGAAFTATDGDGDTLTYSLEGEDADRFTVGSSDGRLRTRVGERYDFETDESHAVTVKVVDGYGGSDTIAVTIDVTNDTTEIPLAPPAPTVKATDGSGTSVDVAWTAPDNTGRPGITSYDLRYRKTSETAWTDGPRGLTGDRAQITGLDLNATYRVEVRAHNADGAGAWSPSGQGRTDSRPTVRFGGSAYTAVEGGSGARVTVELYPAAEASVTVPLTATPGDGATAADYAGVPASVTFAAGETSTTFTVTAAADAVDDDGESVRLGIGSLPSSVALGSLSTATVALVEDAGVSKWYVSFGEASYTAREAGDGALVAIVLSAPWKRNEALTLGLVATPEDGATEADFSGVPETVTFQPGQTRLSFTVRAADDGEDDDGESVTLLFSQRGFPDDLEVDRGPYSATVHLEDNDGTRAVTVSFGAATYAAAEGGAGAAVSVLLDGAPGRSVTVPLTATGRGASSADYAGVPGSVTFGANETRQTFTVTATDDGEDDDLESVTLGFGPLPSRVSAGSPSAATINLTDDDGGRKMLTVRFDAAKGVERSVREGGGAFVGVHLDKPPNRAVTIPLVVTHLGGATTADYSGVPASVTFKRGDPNEGVSVRGVDDTDPDPGEGFRLAFGTLPDGVQVSSWSGPSTTIWINDNDGLPGVSVSDAGAREWPNPISYLKFEVTLNRAAEHEVRVDYTTRDGTATAGQDYVASSGTLVFAEGERSETVWVEVIDDEHDEGTEEMTLELSNPVRARLADATGTGRIRNTDAMPRGFLGRFGRTAAAEVIAQVEERMRASREPSARARLAGMELRAGLERGVAARFVTGLGRLAGPPARGARAGDPMAAMPGAGMLGAAMPGAAMPGELAAAGPMADRPAGAGRPDWGGLLRAGFGVGDLLTGSAFELNRETGRGGTLSLWSRGARSRFAGREGRLSLDGRIATTTAGADYAKGPLVVGLSLAHSRGRGGYEGAHTGALETSVTGLYPWLGYRATDRISVWGVTGYGKGAMSLTPGRGSPLEAGLSMAMAATGLRGELADSVMGGFGLAFKTDALRVATASAGVEGPEGSLAPSGAAVTRFRAGLEASRGYAFGRGLAIEPSLEVGLRQDGGDAETGAGVDVAGGVALSAPAGLRADVRVRTLLAHEVEGFRDRGVSVSLSFDPTPRTPLGFMARVAPSWGGEARSGAEALWGRETMAGLGDRAAAPGNRLEAELGYGLPVGRRLVGTPVLGVGATGTGRDYRLGYRLAGLERRALSFEVGVDAHRREVRTRGSTDHGVLARARALW